MSPPCTWWTCGTSTAVPRGPGPRGESSVTLVTNSLTSSCMNTHSHTDTCAATDTVQWGRGRCCYSDREWSRLPENGGSGNVVVFLKDTGENKYNMPDISPVSLSPHIAAYLLWIPLNVLSFIPAEALNKRKDYSDNKWKSNPSLDSESTQADIVSSQLLYHNKKPPIVELRQDHSVLSPMGGKTNTQHQCCTVCRLAHSGHTLQASLAIGWLWHNESTVTTCGRLSATPSAPLVSLTYRESEA